MILCINIQLSSNGSVRDVYNEFGLVTARGFSSTQEKIEAVAAGTWKGKCKFCLIYVLAWFCVMHVYLTLICTNVCFVLSRKNVRIALILITT